MQCKNNLIPGIGRYTKHKIITLERNYALYITYSLYIFPHCLPNALDNELKEIN